MSAWVKRSIGILSAMLVLSVFAVLCGTSWNVIGAQTGTTAGYWEAVVLEDKYGRRVRLEPGQTGSVGQSGLAELARVYVGKGLRATVCDGAGNRPHCRRLVGPTVDVPTIFAPPFSGASTTVRVEEALFGFADLHVHPAAHLAWGARGEEGVLWGKPGMALTDAASTVDNDLHACPLMRDPLTGLILATHAGSDNPLVLGARIGLLKDRDDHKGNFGYPNFSNWPAASSITHQQMHVTMLRRAYEGGMRLMVASATDNQMLDILWNPAFSLTQKRFAFRENADYNSAVEQFEFIQRFVAANGSWMKIARTPEEARLTIKAGKMAVVLGLEMDELSAEEILKLKAQYGVALVIPVHLINNSFGGAAVYDDFFNVANYLMTGGLYRITGDPTLDFRLKGIEIPVVKDIVGPIAMLPEYSSIEVGHRNRVGLLDEYGIRRLMKAGLLIDVAHMGSAGTETTLDLAEKFGYPVVYSHGGIHCDANASVPCPTNWGEASERAMSLDHFRRLENSGGILGLGTGYDPEDPVTINQWLDRYFETAKIGPVALGTDLNGMAAQIPSSEFMPTASRAGWSLTYPTDTIQKVDWKGNSSSLPMFQLGVKYFNIQNDGIAHIGMLPDFLAVVRKGAQARGRTREFDQIFHSAHDFIATWDQAADAAPGVNTELPALEVSRIDLTIETGTDGLKCGGVMVSAINRVDGQDRAVSFPAMIYQGQPSHSTYRMQLQVLPDTPLRDIDKVRFDYLPNKCSDFDTGDAWNIKTLKVTYDIPYTAIQDGVMTALRAQGVLMHKRGAPARRLDRGESWTVYTER